MSVQPLFLAFALGCGLRTERIASSLERKRLRSVNRPFSALSEPRDTHKTVLRPFCVRALHSRKRIAPISRAQPEPAAYRIGACRRSASLRIVSGFSRRSGGQSVMVRTRVSEGDHSASSVNLRRTELGADEDDWRPGRVMMDLGDPL
jgi:hypothetical protein